LLEHVIFRGTERYPTRQRLEDVFQKHQIDANAYTEREWVSIHMTTPCRGILKAIELACQIGFRPRLREIEVERSIVNAEIRENRVNEGLAFERIGRLLWGNHPLGFPVAGRRLPRTSRKGLKTLHRRFFRPSNSFLIVSGNLDPRAVQRKVRSCLEGVDPGERRLPPAPPARRGPIIRLGDDDSRGLRVVFHLQVHEPLTDPERLLLWIVGRLLEVRLSRIVREDRGVCYDLFVDDEIGHRLNALSVNAVVQPSVGPMVVDEVVHQLQMIKAGSGDPKDLEMVRAGMIRAYELMVDDLHDLTDYYARQALLTPNEEPVRPATARRLARKIDVESVAALAKRVLGPRNLNLVLMTRWNEREKLRWKSRFARLAEGLQ
jgi:predicted Zn-dependent peptidase